SPSEAMRTKPSFSIEMRVSLPANRAPLIQFGDDDGAAPPTMRRRWELLAGTLLRRGRRKQIFALHRGQQLRPRDVDCPTRSANIPHARSRGACSCEISRRVLECDQTG